MQLRSLFLPVFLLAAIAANSQTAEEFYNKGIGLKGQKKSKEALTAFNEATRLNPDYTAAWYEMGWCSNDMGDHTSAIVYLRKADAKWTRYLKVNFELGYAFENIKLYDSAINRYNTCLEIKADHPPAYKQLGTINYYRDNYASSLAFFSKYEQFNNKPITDYLYWYRKGFMLNVQKKHEEAIIALDSSRAIKPNYINTYLELGFAASRLKQNDVAIAHYKKAIEIDPKNHIPCNGIGEVYRDYIKDRNEAMKWYQKSLDLKPNERKACFGMGYCLNSLGKYNEALPYLKTAIEQEKDYTAAYVEIGYSYYMLKNYSPGLDNLKKAITLNPSNTNARYYSCLIYIAQSNKTMAQKMADEMNALNSKDAAELQVKINKM
jgi:tetratricopeptide (TPR) repeat protein